MSDFMHHDLTFSPFWKNRTITAEPVLPIAGKYIYTLWQPIEQIVSVTGAKGEIFRAGTDYRVEEGMLHILPTGSIPSVSPEFPYTVDHTCQFLSDCMTHDGRGLRIAEGFAQHQIAITYQAHSPPPEPPVFGSPSHRVERIRNGRAATLTVFGDSISMPNVASPNASFYEILQARLLGIFHMRNHSLPGKNVKEAAEQFDSLFANEMQDIVVLAFGMNDAIIRKNIHPEIFQMYLIRILEGILLRNPSAYFLLVSGIRANPEWVIVNQKLFDDYNSIMKNIAMHNSNVSMLSIMDIWDDIMLRKSFFDLTANGVNHPNDFVHSLYADGICKALSFLM